jgi:hypothetical protein
MTHPINYEAARGRSDGLRCCLVVDHVSVGNKLRVALPSSSFCLSRKCSKVNKATERLLEVFLCVVTNKASSLSHSKQIDCDKQMKRSESEMWKKRRRSHGGSHASSSRLHTQEMLALSSSPDSDMIEFPSQPETRELSFRPKGFFLPPGSGRLRHSHVGEVRRKKISQK